jgi:hypothetical protein
MRFHNVRKFPELIWFTLENIYLDKQIHSKHQTLTTQFSESNDLFIILKIDLSLWHFQFMREIKLIKNKSKDLYELWFLVGSFHKFVRLFLGCELARRRSRIILSLYHKGNILYKSFK